MGFGFQSDEEEEDHSSADSFIVPKNIVPPSSYISNLNEALKSYNTALEKEKETSNRLIKALEGRCDLFEEQVELLYDQLARKEKIIELQHQVILSLNPSYRNANVGYKVVDPEPTNYGGDWYLDPKPKKGRVVIKTPDGTHVLDKSDDSTKVGGWSLKGATRKHTLGFWVGAAFVGMAAILAIVNIIIALGG